MNNLQKTERIGKEAKSAHLVSICAVQPFKLAPTLPCINAPVVPDTMPKGYLEVGAKPMNRLYIIITFLLIACSPMEDKQKSIIEAGRLNRLREGKLESKTDFRIWINYSRFDIDEMYSLDGDSLIYKLYRPDNGLENFQKLKLKSNQRNLLDSIVENIQKRDAPNDCNYCNEIADGTDVILEYLDNSQYNYRKRNLAERGLEKELYSLLRADSVELQNLWLLIDELEKIRD